MIAVSNKIFEIHLPHASTSVADFSLGHNRTALALTSTFIRATWFYDRTHCWNRKLPIFDKYRTMNTLKYIRLREEGSLNERTFKRATVQKCDWAYEDFQTAEMVQDSTMCTLQGRFRKEDDKNAYLRKFVDTLITVVRIVRRTREIHALYYEKLPGDSEETTYSFIAKTVDIVVEKHLQSMSFSETLEFWKFLDDPSRVNKICIYHPYKSLTLDFYDIVFPSIYTIVF
ncbi:hypothetical protein CEXT_552421 [Caerostris extrusa]|uniref:Uncharacterized protein n=1 Tax=Caerostris extrusa TaxID=172846 RepID=A0AAV4QHZ9_CAEEX|nr:hypothetical protein CEXT_552421 [Caerostris extrusa]